MFNPVIDSMHLAKPEHCSTLISLVWRLRRTKLKCVMSLGGYRHAEAGFRLALFFLDA